MSCFIIVQIKLNAQNQAERPYPQSFMDIGVGVGANFGFRGLQTVIGYKGSGLLLAAGGANGLNIIHFGGQVSHEWFYMSLSYGINGFIIDDKTNELLPNNGLIFMTGVKLNIHPSKKFYLQTGIGYRRILIQTQLYHIDVGGLIFCAGLGYRIAFKKERKAND